MLGWRERHILPPESTMDDLMNHYGVWVLPSSGWDLFHSSFDSHYKEVKMCSSGTFYLYFTIKALTAEIKPFMDLCFSKVQTQSHRQVEIVAKDLDLQGKYVINHRKVGRRWADAIALSIKADSHFSLSVFCFSWMGLKLSRKKGHDKPPCLESKDQGWSPTSCVFSALGGQGSPHDKILYLGK